jgi:predicted TIM-barrel fold metal-dependent hydrolase
MKPRLLSRRAFLAATSAAAAAYLPPAPEAAETITDIHQHTHYHGRSDADLIAHQQILGATKTVLLPAGSKYGLEADAWGNDSCLALAQKYPGQFYFFANELPDIPDTRRVIEKYLKLGAIGIGEQKFTVESDSQHIHLIASIAEHYDAPVLLHFQHGKYNTEFVRFHRVLEKFPRVNFIGHAQTWWGNIDRRHDQSVLYPKGKVTPGGLTDRWLADYPNMYGDLSAGSGLNAMERDEDHAREFLVRHQSKLMYGSDCQDPDGKGAVCTGMRQLALLRRLVTDKKVLNKILSENAQRVLKLK